MLFITPRERDVLQLLADRTARPTIADRLGMSDRELETALLPALFTRLDATGESDALAAAARRGLLAPCRIHREAFPGAHSLAPEANFFTASEGSS